MSYNHIQIDKKWQEYWDKNQTFKTPSYSDKPKYYAMDMFPYPSGAGLHVGHPEGYTATDIICRYKRMKGFNVMHPMGWDAFGLPAEQYAIKTGNDPREFTYKNIANFKRQIKMLGLSYDWTREIATCDPEYFKWTQWIFCQLYKKGLAELKEIEVNWCEGLGTVLANEEIINVNGKMVSERGEFPVEKRPMKQWVLKITAYAERLLKDLDEIDWPESTKEMQRNWIGRSEGAEVKFRLANHDKELVVYTTRPDTLFGATYMVVAPEHPIIKELESEITNLDEVKEYQRQASLKSDFERAELNKEKTGVEIKGIRAVNPLTNTEIPIWVSDYVLITYGTGAIMAVPAHDTRDWEFAKKFSLPIIQVIESANENTVCDIEKEAFTDVASGKLVNSGFLTGLSVEEAKKKVIDYLEENKIGTKKVNYKLRDWVFSRQRYWGEPIPMVHCDKCGWVPLPEEELPLCLPDIEDYEPGENGESPLAKHTDWVNTTCPHCGGKATRETDTMPQWAGSSWYYLRYMDAHNDKALASKEALEYWSPVDWYNGGMEHTTLHLLYSRFWHKFLYDIGVVPTKEPYQKRTSHGMILGSNGEKMSKSKGNVINPDDIVEEFGADTFRVYEMFMGPFDQTAPWSMESIRGCNKFLDRVWNMQEFLVDGDSYSPEFEKMMHKAIKKVSSDIEEMKFNTAVSTFMTMTNEFYKLKRINKAEYKTFLQLLNPFAPHITEELFEIIGAKDTIANTPWPAYDEAKTIDDEIEIPVQVNGKVKATVSIALDTDEAIVKDKVHENQSVKNAISDKNIVKEIYVKNKIFGVCLDK